MNAINLKKIIVKCFKKQLCQKIVIKIYYNKIKFFYKKFNKQKIINEFLIIIKNNYYYKI